MYEKKRVSDDDQGLRESSPHVLRLPPQQLRSLLRSFLLSSSMASSSRGKGRRTHFSPVLDSARGKGALWRRGRGRGRCVRGRTSLYH